MTWDDRDLPVLKAIIEMTEAGATLIQPHEIVERLKMDPVDVRRALAALAGAQPPYLQFQDATDNESDGLEIDAIHSPTEAARRVVGVWPAEVLARQIIAGLEAAAAAEPDEDKRNRLKQTAQFLGGTGWSVLLGVAGNAASMLIGL
ncbi:hypothetical protein [Streptosporangium sp. NPDC001681]|uniref:hypothetical protein n=1 Tax=Streptosporangium sp. NPDC001681 TaxID=3154395 RepID=UPI0033286017